MRWALLGRLEPTVSGWGWETPRLSLLRPDAAGGPRTTGRVFLITEASYPVTTQDAIL